MEQLVRIAPVNACQRSVGERSFDVHYDLGVSMRQRRRLTQQLQHIVHVLQIPVADFLRLSVRLHIVVTVGQPEPTGASESNYTRGIRIVLTGPDVEQHVISEDRSLST